MYLVEYDVAGEILKITPNATRNGIGNLVDKLPITIDEMLELDLIEQVTEQDKIYYKIKGEQ